MDSTATRRGTHARPRHHLSPAPAASTQKQPAGFDVPPDLVPDLIRAIRTAGALSQEALARNLDVSISTVSGWENGKHAPQLRNLRRLEELCRALPAVHPAPGQDHSTRLKA